MTNDEPLSVGDRVKYQAGHSQTTTPELEGKIGTVVGIDDIDGIADRIMSDEAMEIVNSALEKRAAEVIAKAPKKKAKDLRPATPPGDTVPPPNWLDVTAILNEILVAKRDDAPVTIRFILNEWGSRVYRGGFEDGAENIGSCCGCSIQGEPLNPFTDKPLHEQEVPE